MTGNIQNLYENNIEQNNHSKNVTYLICFLLASFLNAEMNYSKQTYKNMIFDNHQDWYGSMFNNETNNMRSFFGVGYQVMMQI